MPKLILIFYSRKFFSLILLSVFLCLSHFPLFLPLLYHTFSPSPMQGQKTKRRGFRSVAAIKSVQIADAQSNTSQSLRDDAVG